MNVHYLTGQQNGIAISVS